MKFPGEVVFGSKAHNVRRDYWLKAVILLYLDDLMGSCYIKFQLICSAKYARRTKWTLSNHRIPVDEKLSLDCLVQFYEHGVVAGD